MAKPVTKWVKRDDLVEGLTSTNKLKKINIQKRNGDIAKTVHSVRFVLQTIDSLKEGIDEKYFKRDILDGKPIPGSSEPIDTDRYFGDWSEKRAYKKGAIFLHNQVFFEAAVDIPKGEKPKADDERFVVIGKQREGIYVAQPHLYAKELTDLFKQKFEIKVWQVPMSVLDEREDISPDMYWFPMLTVEDDDFAEYMQYSRPAFDEDGEEEDVDDVDIPFETADVNGKA